MRNIFHTRTSALTERLASPFLTPASPVREDMKVAVGTRWPERRVPQGNQEFADAAIRYCRTLW